MEHTLNEKKILASIDFPFLVHMDYHFKVSIDKVFKIRLKKGSKFSKLNVPIFIFVTSLKKIVSGQHEFVHGP